MSQIIIQLQGGLVQDVFLKGTGKPNSAIIVDEDVEGADPDDITTVGNYEACIHMEDISDLPEQSDVDRIVTRYLSEEERPYGKH